MPMYSRVWRWVSAWGLLAALLGIPAVAEELDFSDPDLRNGRDINEVCAGCHGEAGQGGKQGEYPRIAGQPAVFLGEQLLLFRDRSRANMAMVEYVDHRQMPNSDIVDVSAFLEALELATKLPPVDPSAADFDALERLHLSKRLMQIPRAPGDLEAGERLYNKECRSCHGREGWGNREKAVPMIAGQHTNYLWRQVERYLKGELIHDKSDPDDRLLAEFTKDEIQNIFAYLSVVDD